MAKGVLRREAVRSDTGLILSLIREIAVFEDFTHEVVVTEEGLFESTAFRSSEDCA